MTKRLTADFFARPVDLVAAELIGVTFLVDGVGGVIVETESYDQSDPASHCFEGRRTPSNAAMYSPPGHAYVYRSYGIHWCINFTCGDGSAALIRALEPTAGVETMIARRGLDDVRKLCAGPGRLCQAPGLSKAQDMLSLLRKPFELRERAAPVSVAVGVRIGITRAVDHPRRFGLAGSRYLSKGIQPPLRSSDR
ncbi:MAG: DNA-3-methyladenine glycosylase [Alphaproteobacteria bacterium]|nr:DNA-3-methyladenine glycosylase [Alphaproteobacteria bacterium]